MKAFFHVQWSRFGKREVSPGEMPTLLAQFLGTEWALNKYVLNVWNGSPPLLLQPVQSVVRQLKALSRPQTHLSTILLEENATTIISRELTTKANKWALEYPLRLEGEVCSRVWYIGRVRGNKRSSLEFKWPWGLKSRNLLSDVVFKHPYGMFSMK